VARSLKVDLRGAAGGAEGGAEGGASGGVGDGDAGGSGTGSEDSALSSILFLNCAVTAGETVNLPPGGGLGTEEGGAGGP
jgi:hypothetical protein